MEPEDEPIQKEDSGSGNEMVRDVSFGDINARIPDFEKDEERKGENSGNQVGEVERKIEQQLKPEEVKDKRPKTAKEGTLKKVGDEADLPPWVEFSVGMNKNPQKLPMQAVNKPPGQPNVTENLPPWVTPNSATSPRHLITNNIPENVSKAKNSEGTLPPWMSLDMPEAKSAAKGLPPWMNDQNRAKSPDHAPVRISKPEIRSKSPQKLSNELPPWMPQSTERSKSPVNTIKSSIASNELPPWAPKPDINTSQENSIKNTSPKAQPALKPGQVAISLSKMPDAGLPPWMPQPEESKRNPDVPRVEPKKLPEVPPWIGGQEEKKAEIVGMKGKARKDDEKINAPPWIKQNPGEEMGRVEKSEEMPPWFVAGKKEPLAVDKKLKPNEVSNIPPWIGQQADAPEVVKQPISEMKPVKNTSDINKDQPKGSLPPWIDQTNSNPVENDSKGIKDLPKPNLPPSIGPDANIQKVKKEPPPKDNLPSWIGPDANIQKANKEPPPKDNLPPWIGPNIQANKEPPPKDNLPPWIDSSDIPQVDKKDPPKPNSNIILPLSGSSDSLPAINKETPKALPPWMVPDPELKKLRTSPPGSTERLDKKKADTVKAESLPPWMSQPGNSAKESPSDPPKVSLKIPEAQLPKSKNPVADSPAPWLAPASKPDANLPIWLSPEVPVDSNVKKPENNNVPIWLAEQEVKTDMKERVRALSVKNSPKSESNPPWLAPGAKDAVSISPPSTVVSNKPPLPQKSQPVKEKIVIKAKRINRTKQKKPPRSSISAENFSQAAPTKQGFIQYGDILCLTSKESLILNESLENYKSVIIGDGISYCDLECVSKRIARDQTNHVQFRQCLFRVEPARQYGYLNVYHKYIQGEHNEKYAEILKKQADEEQQSNEAEIALTFSRTVTYGERIQLRHIHSNSFITISNDIAGEHGALKVKLDFNGSESSWLEIKPGNKLRQEGEPVRYIDGFIVTSKIEKSEYFLHMGISQVKNDEKPFEVNASEIKSVWKAKKYLAVKDMQNTPGMISTGDSFRIMHRDSEKYLCAAPLNVQTLLPEITKDQEAQDNEKTSCVVGSSNKKGGDAEQKDNEVYLEKEKSSRGLWELERIDPFKGGVAKPDESFRLKNVATGLYLHILHPKKLSQTSTEILNINIFKFSNDDMPLKFGNNLIIKQEETKTYIGLVENHISAEKYFKGTSIEKHSEFMLETFSDRKYETQTTFVFEDESEKNSSHVYQISTILMCMVDIYKMINLWGFLDSADGLVSSYQIAVDTEIELESTVNKGIELMDNLKLKILNSDNVFFEDNQTAIKDSGLLELLLKMLQLIDIRLTFSKKSIVKSNTLASKKFSLHAVIQAKTESIILCPQMISRKYLTRLASKIYRILYLCIKDNLKCCEVLKNYSEFLGLQLVSYKEEVSQLLREIFRHSTDALNDSTLEEFEMWARQLRSLSEKEKNWTDQILILKIISSLCVCREKGVRKYQIFVEKYIFEKISHFLYLTEVNTELCVRILPIDEPEAEFLMNNPTIAGLYEQSHSITNLNYIPVSLLTNELNDYICAVINLIAASCLSGNESSIRSVIMNLKVVPEQLLRYINDNRLRTKLKTRLLFLIRVLFVDTLGKEKISEKNTNIYVWNSEESRILHKKREIENWVNELSMWVQSIWSSGTLILNLGTQTGTKIKFIIELINITESLIDNSYVTFEFIQQVSPSLAMILPSYTTSTMVKLTQGTHWCAFLRKDLVQDPGLEQLLVGRVITLFNLINKVKLTRKIEYFIELYSADLSQTFALESNLFSSSSKFSLNFEVTPPHYFNMYLLNVMLSQLDKGLQAAASEQLFMIFNEKKILVDKLNDLILLYDDEMVILNDQITQLISVMRKCMEELQLILSCYQQLDKGIEEKRLSKVLYEFRTCLNGVQVLMNTKGDLRNLGLAQSLFRNQDLHLMLVEFLGTFYPWVIKESAYKRKVSNEQVATYRSVIMALSSFTCQNSRNQELIFSEIAIIISYFGNSIGISRLVSNIAASQRSSNRVDHVISYIFHLISSDSFQFDYSYLKILKNLILDETHHIYTLTQTNIIKLILKSQTIQSCYISNSLWNLIDYSKPGEKFHSTFIALLSHCASQNSFVTMQCRNLVSFQVLEREVLQHEISYQLRLSYLMLILNVFFMNVSSEIQAEYDKHELMILLRKIVIPDISNFSLFMADLICVIQKKKFPAVSTKKDLMKVVHTQSEDSEGTAMELTAEEERALKYWKYLIDVKPWKNEQGSGLLIFVKELSIELKASGFNPSEEFKQIIEMLVNIIQKLKASIEGLTVSNPRMNFEFFIESIGLCLYEIPVYSFENEEENYEYTQQKTSYDLMLNGIRNYITQQQIVMEEFMLYHLQIKSEKISVKSLAYKLKSEIRALDLATINSGLAMIPKERNVMINVAEFKSIVLADYSFQSILNKKLTVVESIDLFIQQKMQLFMNTEVDIIAFIKSIQETVIGHMLDNYEFNLLLAFCNALFTALNQNRYKKYLFEMFTQLIMVESSKAINEAAKKKRIELVQRAIKEAGIGGLALKIIREGSEIDLVLSCLQFLHVMLKNDYVSFSTLILELLKEPYFCFELFSFIKISLKEFKDSLIRTVPSSLRRQRSQKSRIAIQKTKDLTSLCKGLLHLIELLCENPESEFKNAFRDQRYLNNNIIEVNLVLEISSLLMNFTYNDNIKSSDTNEETIGIGMVCLQCLKTLTVLCEGPCVENQKTISGNSKIFVFFNWLIQDHHDLLTEHDTRYIEILKSAVIWIKSLVEGEAEPLIFNVLMDHVDLKGMMKFCYLIYEKFIFGKETEIYRGDRYYKMWWLSMFESKIPPLDAFRVKIIDIAFSIFTFCLVLKEHFPDHPKLVDIRYSSINQTKRPSTSIQPFDPTVSEKSAINFYLEHVSKVEINYNGKIVRLIFAKPFLTVHLSYRSKKYLIKNMSSLAYQAKIEEFFKRCKKGKTEMIYLQRLERYPVIARFCSKWRIYLSLSFYLICVINIILLVSIKQENYNNDFQNDRVFGTILYTLSAFQIIFAILGLLAQFLEYSPILYLAPPRSKDDTTQGMLSRIEGTLLKRELKHFQVADTTKTVFRGLYQVMTEYSIVYSMIYVLISFLAIQNLMWYGLLILDSIKRSLVLKNVLKSITLNYKQLLLALILGLIITYLFSVWGFLSYSSDYNNPKDGVYCESLSDCFFTTLDQGIRAQGGIGTALKTPTPWYDRMLFDMLFFLIIIVVLLKIIFGIIIDTFAELRDIRKQQVVSLQETCFICGKSKFEFQVRRISWEKHINEEHNARSYMVFLIYIMIKKQDFNGIEKYVKKCMDSNEIVFFPKTSLQMDKLEIKKMEETKKYKERFKELQDRIEKIAELD